MPENSAKNLVSRPPIVVVMGHVDHGKTSLLDYLRKTNVVAREAGGITQSIGAYEITHSGKRITFIDTPGHEAFSKMRSRGARVADLAILVVAADEGVKPQTIESIKTLQETNTQFVVAITKIDKPNADVEKVKNELTAAGVLLEGYGGSISYQPISAKSGDHVNELLDLLLLASEMENFTYDPAVPASGIILEAKMDKRRGMEATLIVRNGSLRQGDAIATKSGKGKVKILEDFSGKPSKELVPSSPALVIGFSELPQVGEEFVTGEAANIDLSTETTGKIGEAIARSLTEEDKETLNLILKASDLGSLEALSEILRALPSEKRSVKIVDQSVGDINDNDIKLAISTKSKLIAFRSKTDKSSFAMADANRIQIISSDIIYKLIEAIQEMLKESESAPIMGELEVLAVFNQAKLDKQLVGGKVRKGFFKNKGVFEIIRGKSNLGTGRILNLQQKKQEVTQVAEGNECGLLCGSAAAIVVGDVLIIRDSH